MFRISALQYFVFRITQSVHRISCFSISLLRISCFVKPPSHLDLFIARQKAGSAFAAKATERLMQESLYADNAIPSSSNRPRSYTCRLCGKARHNGRTCNAPSIDYQMKGVPSLVAELAQGVPVVPVPSVVTDVDEFPPNAT